jgi:hypothetical protein
MSVSLAVFDVATRRQKSITVDVGGAAIIQDLDADLDFFLTVTTTAKQVGGSNIPAHTIRSLTSGMPQSGLNHSGGAASYATMSAAITDHAWDVVDGSAGINPMSFT